MIRFLFVDNLDVTCVLLCAFACLLAINVADTIGTRRHNARLAPPVNNQKQVMDRLWLVTVMYGGLPSEPLANKALAQYRLLLPVNRLIYARLVDNEVSAMQMRAEHSSKPGLTRQYEHRVASYKVLKFRLGMEGQDS